MAKRRCISSEIIHNDHFANMPASTQMLYVNLLCEADDDGFVDCPERVVRSVGFATRDDLNLLCAKGFIIPFESGVIVITDWRAQNTLKNDRYKPTKWVKEKSLLFLNDSKRYEVFNKEFNKISDESIKN